MRTLVQFNDWRVHLEGRDKSEREIPFPGRHHTIKGVTHGSSTQELNHDAPRIRWLKANDVHTQFIDVGIGCFWFAQQGDQEPVSGETEHEAIARLARENGIELWGEGTSTNQTEMGSVGMPLADGVVAA